MRCHWLTPMEAPLASRFYAGEGQKEKVRRDERVAVCRGPDGAICAAVRFSPRQDHHLMRALRVAHRAQGQGVARTLMRFALDQAPSPLWSFALPPLVPFYRSLGFEPVTESAAPEAILGPLRAYQQHQPLVLLRYADSSPSS
ncbi:GNAT family N-acetyltransferase [Ferrimonas balearica]|uniref:GNAT family N-acetyltransferase n=1 Tax=Ferrimonas balearica TaxID=44012 RepID=UPI001C9A178B|nr:GNAT family N-acetyltransferase [Ferrimonas balearica]MBY5994146.1 GNAT family N-acetyltransferase [Ferrimonas balearica]